MFVVSMERGIPVFIPDELTQDKFPKSFTYYDCILPLLDEQLDENIKQKFLVSNLVAYELFFENSKV